MADENTGLVVIDIKPESYPTLYVTNGLDSYLDQIRQEVNEVPDLSTAKGRARIASLAASVSSSKAAIEKPGRDYLKKLKEAVKPAEAEIKRFVDACNALRDETRRPLTEWEAEQERIRIEEAAKAEAERYSKMRDDADKDNAAFDLAKAKELALQIEAAHATALLDNYEYDRDIAEKNAEAERKRKAYEEELKLLAENAARLAVEREAQIAREEAAHRESVLKAQAEQAERDRVALALKAEQDKKDAAAKAEREKQEAIAAEQRKAQEEADRIKREAQQKENARLAEEKRVADEAAARAANVEHKRAINQQAVADLVATGIPEECAVQCVKAIAKGQVSAIAITY
ncbi:hypothetical protein [Yersinia pseudotuberculosis]|uniref:hypothetical protein n=1 Tax=Yersinia pseudotuberculosis TaxID=633 RepID=UPI002B28BBED|nr:hypothetical protein YPSE1_43020 [Yersinia pseudotuberculosis]